MAVVINGTTGITSVNGSAAAPSVTGTDTDTGIVYGTNTLSLATGGTTAVTVDSSQNVGIGTSSPAYKLDVNGQGRFGGAAGVGYINFNSTVVNNVAAIGCAVTTGYGDSLGLAVQNATGVMTFATNSTERMRIDSGGNVGIGASPLGWSGSKSLTLLTPSGSVYTSLFTVGNTVGLTSNAYYDGTNWKYGINYNAQQYYMGDGSHIWRTASASTGTISWSEPMRIASNGSVGIGVTDPGYRLEVASADTTAGFGYAIRVRANATAQAGAIQFTNNPVSAETGYIRVTNAGLMSFSIRLISTPAVTCWWGLRVSIMIIQALHFKYLHLVTQLFRTRKLHHTIALHLTMLTAKLAT